MTNPMRTVKIDKVTLNFGAGKDQAQLEKGVKLIKMVAGEDPVKTITQKRIPGWGLRPGLPIGVKLTLRGKKAQELLKRLLDARSNRLPESCVDDQGNISFGIPEYIDVPGTKYDPAIGIIGFECSVTLIRPGYRVQRRKIKARKVHHRHHVDRAAAKEYMRKEFNTEFTT